MSRLGIAWVVLLVGCGQPGDGTTTGGADGDPAAGLAANDALSVYVVNYPLEYFAERIGGEHVDVRSPVPDGVSSASFSPDTDAIAALQSADLILLNGATFAKWVETTALPTTRTFDTSASFSDRYVTVENAVVHSHGPEGEHSHGETAVTTWLDPTLALEQARAIRDALAGARPDARADFDAGYESLAADLQALDERFEEITRDHLDVPLIASSSAFAYLARRYEWNVHTVPVDPDHALDDDGWHDLTHAIEDHAVRHVLWTKSPEGDTAARLESIGVGGIVFSPCTDRPAAGDYLSVMESNAATLVRTFADEP